MALNGYKKGINNMRTQKDDILERLQKHNKITSLEAFKKYGITRLSAVIFNLRQEGCNIVSINKQCKTRYGRTTHYVEYRLV